MKFGTKKRDVVETDFNSNYLRNFKKGETKVRFLEETDEWMLYQEHFTRDRQSFPCTNDTNACPGCTSEDEQMQRRSRKYGTHLLLVDPNLVLPFKLSISLANRLMARAERNNGTITNRDYVIIRSGEGLQTEYDVDQDEKYTVDTNGLLNKVEASIEEILADMYGQVWDEAPKENTSTKRETGTRDTSQSAQSTKESTTDDVPDALLLKHEREAKGMDVLKGEPENEEEVTEAQIRAMNRKQLEELWDKAGWDKPAEMEDWGKSELVDAILKMAD